MAGLVNKVKDALHSDKSHEAPQGATGPHGSKVANTVDPRVDSDRDHRANPATGTNNVTGFDDPTGTHGPHGSRITNAADPRVDSDRDHRGAGLGGSGTHTGAGPIGSTGAHTGHTGTGPIGSTGTHTGHTGTGPIGSTGAHTGHTGTTGHSNFAGNSGHTGYDGQTGHTGNIGHSDFAGNTGHTGHTGAGTGAGIGNSNLTSGYNDPTGTHGPHGSRVTNAADPRIDSDRDHRGAPGTAGTLHAGSGPGPAAHTAGPHKSDALNKVDPRVDSDLDGSKTVGGDKTYQHTGTNSLAHKDPTDASQVPPSVLREAVGDPVIEHGDHSHGREGRQQSISHQDAHRGI
ncbi:hypothetical protein VMCG_09097 [Cytospora schulzeri]|uniref:Cell surface protein n=1 Tax=Cytospora schulzeri TaxID=448051 RepID=A0A423VN19_9PEZI|nr:hypothetical protein VMCG_09097 [Valsa malicola]